MATILQFHGRAQSVFNALADPLDAIRSIKEKIDDSAIIWAKINRNAEQRSFITSYFSIVSATIPAVATIFPPVALAVWSGVVAASLIYLGMKDYIADTHSAKLLKEYGEKTIAKDALLQTSKTLTDADADALNGVRKHLGSVVQFDKIMDLTAKSKLTELPFREAGRHPDDHGKFLNTRIINNDKLDPIAHAVKNVVAAGKVALENLDRVYECAQSITDLNVRRDTYRRMSDYAELIGQKTTILPLRTGVSIGDEFLEKARMFRQMSSPTYIVEQINSVYDEIPAFVRKVQDCKYSDFTKDPYLQDQYTHLAERMNDVLPMLKQAKENGDIPPASSIEGDVLKALSRVKDACQGTVLQAASESMIMGTGLTARLPASVTKSLLGMKQRSVAYSYQENSAATKNRPSL